MFLSFMGTSLYLYLFDLYQHTEPTSDFLFKIANAEITPVMVWLQVCHQVAASTNPSRQGSLVMTINSRFVPCIWRGSVTSDYKRNTCQNIPVAPSEPIKGDPFVMEAVKLHCESTGSTDGVVSSDSQPINTVNITFYNLVLLNQKVHISTNCRYIFILGLESTVQFK